MSTIAQVLPVKRPGGPACAMCGHDGSRHVAGRARPCLARVWIDYPGGKPAGAPLTRQCDCGRYRPTRKG